MIDRKGISLTIRKKVLKRDGNCCRKCGKREKLEMHHIKPITEGQDNAVDNLLALCTSCHREWEHAIYPHTGKITFDQWLTIPTALELIALFLQPWPDNIDAKAAKEGMLQGYEAWKSFRANAQTQDDSE